MDGNKNLIVWSDALIIDGAGRSSGELFTARHKADSKPKSGKLFSTLLLRDNYVCAQSMIFRRDLIDEMRFDRRLVYLNDYKFVIDLSALYDFHFIDEPLVRCRLHGDNSIYKNRDVWQKDSFKIDKYVLEEYCDRIHGAHRAKLYRRMSQYLHERSHLRHARYCLLKAIEANPGKTSLYRRLLQAYLRDLVL